MYLYITRTSLNGEYEKQAAHHYTFSVGQINSYGQVMHWWNPADAKFAVVSGQQWPAEPLNFYNRLPAAAEKSMSTDVWHLSHNSAGEYISFLTDAANITVKYKVNGARNMPHMPTTGVSGVDLYLLDSANEWHWVHGSYSFTDTIEYKFTDIDPRIRKKEFRLYLPLYNTPTWLTIGVPELSVFKPMESTTAAAIVMYGTSIMQGACASRPGLAWGNILGRMTNAPVINLGFSGNGLLEPAIIALMAETNASLFVLDCMPNLYDRRKFSADTVAQRLNAAVQLLQRSKPQVPIILAEHCCGLPAADADTGLVSKYQASSLLLRQTYMQLLANNVKGIYLLKDTEIGFTMESTVDGTHPNDIGMMQYAVAYATLIKQIMKQQKPSPKKDKR